MIAIRTALSLLIVVCFALNVFSEEDPRIEQLQNEAEQARQERDDIREVLDQVVQELAEVKQRLTNVEQRAQDNSNDLARVTVTTSVNREVIDRSMTHDRIQDRNEEIDNLGGYTPVTHATAVLVKKMTTPSTPYYEAEIVPDPEPIRVPIPRPSGRYTPDYDASPEPEPLPWRPIVPGHRIGAPPPVS